MKGLGKGGGVNQSFKEIQESVKYWWIEFQHMNIRVSIRELNAKYSGMKQLPNKVSYHWDDIFKNNVYLK